LTIKNISTVIKVVRKAGHPVTSSVATSAGSINIGGDNVAVPEPGEVLEFLNADRSASAGEADRGAVP